MYSLNERAAARVALRALDEKPEFSFKVGTLRRSFGETVLARIKAETDFAAKCNKDAMTAKATGLSPAAGEYWSDVLALIARGKAAQASGDRDALTRVSRDAELLAESFTERVQSDERALFKMLDPQDHAATWDDRWEYIEHDPPLLRDEFVTAYTIPNVKNYAQRQVLGEIAIQWNSAEEAESARKRRQEVRYIAQLDDHEREMALAERLRKDAEKAHWKGLTKDQRKARKKLEADARRAAAASSPNMGDPIAISDLDGSEEGSDSQALQDENSGVSDLGGAA